MSFVDDLKTQRGAPLEPGNLARAAATLGVEQDVLGAFIDVEAGGSGFDKNGRIQLLFEKHHFWKHIDPARRQFAADAGLARSRWIAPPEGYADQKTLAGKWELLDRAARFDEVAALKSCSWGAGQVMGSHYEMLDFASVEGFVAYMAKSEFNQIDVMTRFIRKAGLVDELERKDWRGAARGYNGAGNALVYAAKLARAYTRRVAMPDDLLEPAPFRRPEPTGLLFKGVDAPEAVKALQAALVAAGRPLDVDGDFGDKTKAAVLSFQRDKGLTVDGVVGAKTRAALGLE